MPIILDKNLPILKTQAQLRRNDVLRGMCRYVNCRRNIDKFATDVSTKAAIDRFDKAAGRSKP